VCDCWLQAQCIDDEYTLDGELFTVECRTAANMALLDNLLRDDEFQPHGQFVLHILHAVSFCLSGPGVSGLVVECRTRNFQITGSYLTAGHLQATLSKLLTYGVLRSTQPPTFRRTGMSSSLRAIG